jgi:GNAT superfamily N-acetyltransferase
MSGGDEFSPRAMGRDDWAEVAELIHLSTNVWYQAGGRGRVFTGSPAECEIFCATYEALDPGCCVVVVNERTGRIVGSCFYHPRETHVSVGIVNTHPGYFGKGIARRMMDYVIGYAEAEGKPVRLVSSAMNLDSYSLYTRLGFVPRMAFQDMYLAVPAGGLDVPPVPGGDRVRPGEIADAPKMAALEAELVGIRREKDYRHFLQNRDGIWGVSVLESASGDGSLDGFLVSVAHPASVMLGPGVTRTEADAAALIRAELDRRRGLTPVFLAPVECAALVQTLYSWGARNCEMHFAQIRGDWTRPTGIVLPTFLPETG